MQASILISSVGRLTVRDLTLNMKGHAGWTTDSVDVHIGDWLTSFTPDEILILVGTNDISLGIPMQLSYQI